MIHIIPDFEKSLKENFFLQPTEIVAEKLLGKIFVLKTDNDVYLAGRIVETEAYLSENDEASHSWRGITNRNKPMFAKGGIMYVYKSYGIHHCTNIVTEKEGIGAAVLIRAAEPLLGIDILRNNRKISDFNKLSSGPGNFSKAFGLDLSYNNQTVTNDNIFIQDESSDNFDIVRTKRVGISRSTELLLRFYIKNSTFISKK